MKYLRILCLIGILACSRKPAGEPELKVPAMDLTTITDTITIDLDAQINDYRIVPLETSATFLIGDGAKYIFVSDDDILVETEKGLQQFTRQGRFIRQLMS